MPFFIAMSDDTLLSQPGLNSLSKSFEPAPLEARRVPGVTATNFVWPVSAVCCAAIPRRCRPTRSATGRECS